MVPQFDVEIDRVKTQTLHVTLQAAGNRQYTVEFFDGNAGPLQTTTFITSTTVTTDGFGTAVFTVTLPAAGVN